MFTANQPLPTVNSNAAHISTWLGLDNVDNDNHVAGASLVILAMFGYHIICCFVSVEQTNRINALLEWSYRYGYVDKIHCLSDLLSSVDLALFDKMQSKGQCLYPLLPQSEVNLIIYAVGAWLYSTLMYQRSSEEFFRHGFSVWFYVIIPLYCFIVWSYYTLTLGLQVLLRFDYFICTITYVIADVSQGFSTHVYSSSVLSVE